MQFHFDWRSMRRICCVIKPKAAGFSALKPSHFWLRQPVPSFPLHSSIHPAVCICFVSALRRSPLLCATSLSTPSAAPTYESTHSSPLGLNPNAASQMAGVLNDYNQSDADPRTKIGNWVEERALREATGFARGSTHARKKDTGERLPEAHSSCLPSAVEFS